MPESLILPRPGGGAEAAAGNPKVLPAHPHQTGGESIEPWRREDDIGHALAATSLLLFQEHLVETSEPEMGLALVG